MAATTSQWWRRLVNAYEVKAGTVYLQPTTGAIQIFVALPLPLLGRLLTATKR